MTTLKERLSPKLAEAQNYYEHGQVRSHLRTLNAVLDENPSAAALLHYQLGVTHHTGIGSGFEARRLFGLALQEAGELPETEAPLRQEIEAYCLENLLLLAESYEECLAWAARLEQKGAASPAVQHLIASIRQNQECDNPWHQTMLGLAATFYDQKVGRQGDAAAIFDLLIRSRRALRINRADSGDIMVRYVACTVHLASGHAMKMHRSLGYTDPQEFNFIVEEIRPGVQKFVEENPQDRAAAAMLDKVDEFLKIPAQRKNPAAERGFVVTDSSGQFMPGGAGMSGPRAGGLQQDPMSGEEPDREKPVLPWYVGIILFIVGLFGGAGLFQKIIANDVLAFLVGGFVGVLAVALFLGFIETIGHRPKKD